MRRPIVLACCVQNHVIESYECCISSIGVFECLLSKVFVISVAVTFCAVFTHLYVAKIPTKSDKSVNKPNFKKLYTQFSKIFTRAFSRRDDTFGKNVQVELNLVWNGAKKHFDEDDKVREKYIEQCISDYNIEYALPKKTGQMRLLDSFQKAGDKLKKQSDHKIPGNSREIDGAPLSPGDDLRVELSDNLEASNNSSGDSMNTLRSESEIDKDTSDITDTYLPKKVERSYPKPAQDRLRKNVHFFETRLSAQLLARKTNSGGDTSEADIDGTQKNLNLAKRSLESTQKNAAYQQNLRKKRKMIQDSQLCSDSNNTGDLVQRRAGRPSLDTIHPDLHDTIIEIASFGAAAHGRRHTNEFRAARTLDDLRDMLNTRLGINVSRNAVYLRLLPPLNDEHKSHPDTRFCITPLRYLEALASALGPQQVAHISQDDKARVALGITAAKKRSPILMHTEHRVKLPDHDFVEAQRHKLISSVVTGIKIRPKGLGNPEAMTYLGPTYIAIRSEKHDSSTAFSHATDFMHLLEID
ncbi:hypothetical protein QAD02_013533 [Eretmocerus hayati]|uniref:Uncharacterized protein n=1 Tax=Eretmocerus hayati TaxID=131215 RepID=A0ACC2P3V7_9HYME|nr:hypothetical protein QAD02_013533 [Eretmocerus hayati]